MTELARKGLVGKWGLTLEQVPKSISLTDRTNVNENRPWQWAMMLPWQQAGWACSLASVSSGVRQAAPRRFEVFNLLSGRKQAAVLDAVNALRGGLRGERAWVRCGKVEGGWVCGGQGVVDYRVRHRLQPLASKRRHDRWKKVVGAAVCFCLFLCWFSAQRKHCIVLPSRSSNGQLQRYERRGGQTDRLTQWESTCTHTLQHTRSLSRQRRRRMQENRAESAIPPAG